MNRYLKTGLSMFLLSVPYEIFQERFLSEPWADITGILFAGGLILTIFGISQM